MKSVRYILAVSLFVALMLLSSKLVLAQPHPNQYYGSGGGMITGTIFGFNMWDQLEPVDWASVHANNGQRTFVAYSGAGGFYEMFVPTGLYNVTVVQPGYVNYSNTVAVSDGSTSSINVYLELSHVPVPEFQPNLTLMLMILTLGTALVIRRRSLKRSKG
ncbi:MAG: carboxypeptidase regulatory-like domain-containing protein [Candidatus Bathyarchaeia archaeon]